MTDERTCRLELSLRVEPGDPSLARLVDRVGIAAARDHVVKGRLPGGTATPAGWRAGRGSRWADAADALLTGARDWRWVVPGDDEWPEQLADLAHAAPVNRRGGPPVGLWVRGPLSLREVTTSAVAVVGARSATTYGTEVAADLAAGLAGHEITVVSGAAFGIDSAAHRGALALRCPTVAVLACGVDVAYPRAHESLIRHIAETGLVVSELPPGEHPTKQRFLSRNRVIAALARGVVIVEAAVRSGALNTASWSEALGRMTMAVPGPVTSAASVGAHGLIRDGRALLVTDVDDIREAVSPLGTALQEPARAADQPVDLLGERQRQVLEAMPARRPLPAAVLAEQVALPLPEVLTTLAQLADRCLVVRDDGQWRLH